MGSLILAVGYTDVGLSLSEFVSEACKHFPNLFANCERRIGLVFSDVLQPNGNQQMSFNFLERSVGNRKMLDIFPQVSSPVPLSNIRRDGNGCSSKLISQPIDF